MNICVPEDAEQEDMFAAAKEAAVAAAKAAVEEARAVAAEASTREAVEAVAREVAAAAAAAAAAAPAAAAENERMERLVVRLLAERLLYLPELGEFDLPYSIDIKEMPSKAVEALVRYGPYKLADNSNPYIYWDPVVRGGVPPTRTFDTIYLTSNLEPWRRIIAEATTRRRT